MQIKQSIKRTFILIAVVAVVFGIYGIFVRFDTAGITPSCLQAVAADDSGRAFKYVDEAGVTQDWKFGDGVQAKIIGLKPNEKIGINFTKGKYTSSLYNLRFYLLSENQKTRVYEFDIVKTGSNQSTIKPVNIELPMGCPKS